MKIGDKIKVIETIILQDSNGLTWDKQLFWDGEIVDITDTYVETKHRRNAITHPYWDKFRRAYDLTYTKHFFHPHGLINIIFYV